MLLYYITHTTDSPCPTWASVDNTYDALTAVLRSWSESIYKAPGAIAYLLEGTYLTDVVASEGLSEADTAKIHLLSRVAPVMGFEWGFARAVSHKFGPANEEQSSCAGPMLSTLAFSRLKAPDGSLLLDELLISDSDDSRRSIGLIPEDLWRLVERSPVHEVESHGQVRAPIRHHLL